MPHEIAHSKSTTPSAEWMNMEMSEMSTLWIDH